MTTIKPFTISQYDEVVALWNQCEGVGLSKADSRENIQFYLERNPKMSFIACQAGRIVGNALCGHDGRRGFIHHLAVHPNDRRQGIAKQLVQKCQMGLKAVGIQKCHIFIFKDNHSGIAFWQSAGWAIRTDIQVMSKVLDVEGEQG